MLTDPSERPTEPRLRQIAQKIAEELPALARFLKDEHGPIGWEYQLGIWERQVWAALAREPVIDGLPKETK